MTTPNPFEAPSVVTQVSRPSILGPTLLTAAVAAMFFALPSIARGIDPGFACCWNCTAGLIVSCLGALPAWMFSRQGPYYTGGHAFAAAFLGVGLGAGVGVLLQVVAPGMDRSKLSELTKQVAEQLIQESERQGQRISASPSDIQDMAEGLCLAAPVPMALIGAVLAGFVGMITLGLLTRRSSPPGQHPPGQHPVNPWSSPGA